MEQLYAIESINDSDNTMFQWTVITDCMLHVL